MLLVANKIKTLLSVSLFLTLCLTDHPAKADINVNGNQPLVRKSTPPYIGGTTIEYHNPRSPFVTRTPIDYQSELRTAKSKMVRLGIFPDPRTIQSISSFDDKVKAILKSGAVPFFYAPIEPGLNYYKSDGTLGGGTPASNIVYLVKRYKAAPYYLNTQYWQVSNEPDLSIDYQVSSKDEYADTFNSVHNALISAGLRNNVKLAGPGIAFGYHEPWWFPLNTVKGTDPSRENYRFVLRKEIMDTFLARCNQAVDIVTYVDYSGDSTGNWPYLLLNAPRYLDNKENSKRTVVPGDGNPDSNTSDRGLASLLKKMSQYKFARNPGIGVVEHNTDSRPSFHTLYQGLWQLMLTHHVLYNNTQFPGILDTSFIFSAYGSEYGYFGHFDSNKARNYAYWALWIRGNLTGNSGVLNVTQSKHLNNWGNPHLVVTATKGGGYMYLEVVNRSSSGITDTVTLNGIGVRGLSTIYQMYKGKTPDAWTHKHLGMQFSFYFPPYSATVIKIPV